MKQRIFSSFTMKWFILLATAVLAITALPVEREIDLGREGDFFYYNANLTQARVPAGQVGFATLNGGTTGGAGGSSWTVWDAWAFRDALDSNDPRIVNVRGQIDLLQIFEGSPGVRVNVGSRTTINGGGATLINGGLLIRGQVQVIVQDLYIHNALSYAPGEQPNGAGGIINQVPGAFSTIDNVAIDRSHNVWVDHCHFSDDPWNAAATPEDRRRHNSLLSVYGGANWVSVSNTIFRNHNMNILVGASDATAPTDVGKLKTTWYYNWFQGTVQRNPLVRWAENHILNNLYTDISSYGIGVWIGSLIYSERNAFVNCRRAWGWSTQPPPNPTGAYFNFNNLLVNSGFDSGIPAQVNWNPANYYNYGAIANTAVENYVRRNAGPR